MDIGYLVIQDKEGGRFFAVMKCWDEVRNGNIVRRFLRITEFTDNKNDALSFIAANAVK